MSFEEEFDKIIRQKSEEMEFPFDDKHWANASAMIESDKKAVRVLKFKKALKPALAFVTLATVALITWTKLNDQTELSEPLALKPAEQSNAQPNEKSSETAKILSQPNSIHPIVISDKLKPTQNQEISNTQRPAEPIASAQERSAPKSPSNRENSFASKTSDHTSESSAESASESASTTNLNSNIPLKNKSNVGAAKVSGALLNPQINNSDPIVSIKEEDQGVSETHISEQNISENNEIAALENLNEVDQLKAFSLSLPADQPERILDADKMMTIINYDNAYFKAKRKTHYLNLEAGAAYLMGWNTSSDKDGKGFDYFAGINYGFYLSNKLSLGIGVQGYNVAHMNDPYYASSHKEYDFGSTTIYTVVTCSELFYAAIPIKLNYILNKANSFGIGLNAAYLMNANVNTESYYYQDNAKIQTGNSSQKAIYEGIDQYNYMLTAHYSHRFGKRIALNVEGMYGLTDLFKNTEGISSTERSNGIRLSVSYILFDK